ncbi:interactor of HORMAD1 protein 1 [Rhinoderma darwinii]|uniref:interactor of HORMAD1 protein 1 n=1 Tax=Rhinoderma darwinii TaxID=43563 RepID=UPI003F669BD5
MNLNVWNIKDMFSVPPGAGMNKSANRNAAQSDHSSLSDSQFLFGSQFGPDGSQQGSMDYNTQTKYQRNSNQNSQDSEPSIYQKYQSKPPLCSIDSKDKNTFHPFGPTKAKDIIEQFEESKKRTKEKQESEQLNQLISNIQGTLQDLKVPFFNMEENTNLRCQTILDSINAVSKALQEKISSYNESMLKVVPQKSELEQAMLDLEKKLQMKDAEMTDLKSNIQLLLIGLDAIKLQQSEKHLELSEKLTQLSDSMQSSEERILSEIRKNKLVLDPVCSSEDKTTQTSPTSVHEHITSQCNTISPCPDGPSPSPAIVPCTCGGISKTFSSQHRENPCVTEVKDRKTFNETSAGSIGNSLGVPNDQRKWKNVIAMNDTAVTSAYNLKHLHQDDRCMPLQHDNPSRNIHLYSGKENQIILTRSKDKNNSSKRPKTNKRRRGLKKKRTKDAAQVPPRADNSKQAPDNKPVTQQWVKSVKATRECFTLSSQNCGSSSLAVSPVLLRKTKKNSLTFSLLRSQQIKEPSEMKTVSSGDRNIFAKKEKELGHGEVPSWDSNNPNCGKSSECEEDKMVWFPSSSPLHHNSSTHPAQKTGQKDLISLFFESSDDTD